MEAGSIRPCIGGGLAFVNAETRATNFNTVTEEDSGTGIWFDGGVYWTFDHRLNLALGLRYLQADITLAGIDGEAGGVYVGIILGRHWW